MNERVVCKTSYICTMIDGLVVPDYCITIRMVILRVKLFQLCSLLFLNSLISVREVFYNDRYVDRF